MAMNTEQSNQAPRTPSAPGTAGYAGTAGGPGMPDGTSASQFEKFVRRSEDDPRTCISAASSKPYGLSVSHSQLLSWIPKSLSGRATSEAGQAGSHAASTATAAAASVRRSLTIHLGCLAALLLTLLYFNSGFWSSPSLGNFWTFGGISPNSSRIAYSQSDFSPFMGNDGVKTNTDPFSSALPEALLRRLQQPWRGAVQSIPVVQFYQRPGPLTCNPKNYIAASLKQARKHNDLVYFIGPEECASLAKRLDIILDPITEYRDVVEWFQSEIGEPVGYQVRWFVLRKFMERHGFPRVFYTDSDVLLFANMTDLSSKLFRHVPILLPVRWPSLRFLSPSQYASTAVAGHVSMWTYDALCDFLTFFQLFMKEAVLFGKPGSKTLVTLQPYNDMVLLGWYTYKICWMSEPQDLHPQCIGDKASGVTPERSIKLRGNFVPKFRVESFSAPRWCTKTDYVDEGWCAFDNNFSVQSPKGFFKYRPQNGMKTPTSMHYTHFKDWSIGQRNQSAPIQFLAVHFQGPKKKYLQQNDDPQSTWGSSLD